ncbi:hypothetical protein C8263_18370 [Deinococcus arcticus]|uniref:Uncharacterized protein n=2 Tax=Deinococcus arcticus TaxID=2136176 RepID=A0A2T3W378_9DEIO|nr:hypothetical protein C8263_18370 [Deinococcus arcticus]
MSKMTDAQGRETHYSWDALTRKLLSVVETGPGGQEIAKRTEFKYTPIWKYHYLSEVTERTFDGLGGEAVRRSRYGYSEYSKPEYLNYDVRLTSESREILGTGANGSSSQWVTTFYTKDDQARITNIRKVAGLSADGPRLEPDTVISLTTSQNS